MRMVLEGASSPSRIDLPLLKAVARARRWSDDLLSGRVPWLTNSRGGKASMVHAAPDSARVLSPRVVEAIVEGREPPDLTVIALTRRLVTPVRIA